MTKTKLLNEYRAVLPGMFPWARDEDKLTRFVASAERTIRTSAATWNHDSPAIAAAWRKLGGKGKPTLKAMRALPE